jgi:hypothetical protein
MEKRDIEVGLVDVIRSLADNLGWTMCSTASASLLRGAHAKLGAIVEAVEAQDRAGELVKARALIAQAEASVKGV